MTNTIKLSVVIVLFAVLGLLIKIIGDEAPVFTQMFWRMLLASSLLTIFWGIPQALKELTKKDLLIAISRAFFLTVIGGGCWILALSSEKIGVVTFLTCLPYEALCGALLFKERINLLQWVGLALGVFGIALFTDMSFSQYMGMSLGAFLAILCGLGWALGISMARFHSKYLDNLSLSLLVLWCGVVWSGIGIIVTSQPVIITGSYSMWAAFLSSILIVATTTWILNDLARNMSLVSMAIGNLAQPVLAAFIAYLAFNEVLSSKELIGAVFIITATLLPFLTCIYDIRCLSIKRLGA